VLLRRVAYFLIDPVGLCISLLLLGLLLRYKHRKLLVYFAIAAAAVFILCATPPLPEFLVASLERRYEPLGVRIPPPPHLLRSGQHPDSTASPPQTAQSPPLPIHILVLGGGHVSDERLPTNDQLSDQALKRLVEGIRIHKMLPGSKLVYSGYARAGIPQTHAEVMGETAVMLGIDPKDTLLVRTPWNTMHEAIDYHQKFGDKHPLVLVTNAIHMPRAMMHFQRAGLSPTPAPTGFLIKKDKLSNSIRLKPGTRNLRKMRKALHEYVGLLVGKIEWHYQERN